VRCLYSIHDPHFDLLRRLRRDSRHSAAWIRRPEADANGERRVWVDVSVANKLSAMRGSRESLSDVILRLAALEALGPTKVDPLDELVRIVGEAERHKPEAPKRGPDRRRVSHWRR
jgi:hypothetical protein